MQWWPNPVVNYWNFVMEFGEVLWEREREVERERERLSEKERDRWRVRVREREREDVLIHFYLYVIRTFSIYRLCHHTHMLMRTPETWLSNQLSQGNWINRFIGKIFWDPNLSRRDWIIYSIVVASDVPSALGSTTVRPALHHVCGSGQMVFCGLLCTDTILHLR